MKNKNPFIFLAIGTFLLPSIALEAVEIRQELYEFQMNITQNTTCTTFVIKEVPGTNSVPTQSYNLPKIHFELGSAVLSPVAAQQLLASMNSHEIAHNTPLIITGHSCELGTEQSNLMLSRQRAVAVVNFLGSQGFTATTLQAKGEADPTTTNTQQLYKNRRVEITAQLPTQ
jgi:outer membrane protein OmpA-like peptidoglycan-associated protein